MDKKTDKMVKIIKILIDMSEHGGLIYMHTCNLFSLILKVSVLFV